MLYGLFFRFGRLLPCKDSLVALISPHNAVNDSLTEVENELKKQGVYDFLHINGSDIRQNRSIRGIIRFFVTCPFRLARAKYILLNDNFMPLATLPLKKGTVVIQMWHGEGALKKINLALDLPDDVVEREKKLYAKYTYIVCSSKSIVPVWAEAFGKDEKDVLPLGSPRTDAFFRAFDYESAREKFDKLYPECKGRKLVLYAPTFRDNPDADAKICNYVNAEAFNTHFGDRYALLTRLHPQVHSCRIEGTVDVTSFPDIGELLRLADVLITDYSSVFMDYIFTGRPVIFYAPDLDEYSDSRSFYGEYEKIVPGKVVKSFDDLISELEFPEVSAEKYSGFIDYHLGACDGHSAQRVAELIKKSR